MTAAILRSVGQGLSVEDVDIDLPGPREVLIRTVATGVCHSDLHYIEGSYPYRLPTVLGHEAAGIVDKIGPDVRTVQPGDHVVARDHRSADIQPGHLGDIGHSPGGCGNG